MNLKAALLAFPLATALVACPDTTQPPPAPDFTISSISPTSLTFTKPATGNPAAQTVNVTVAATGGFAGAVTLSLVAPGGSTGVTGTGSITAGTASGTLSVNATAAATVGANQGYTLQAVSGTITKTIALPITVNAAAAGPSALGVSVGTYNIVSAGGTTTKGFAMLVRVRDGSNAIVNGFASGVNYTVAGPASFNGGVNATVSAPGDFIVGALNAFGVFRNPPGGTGFTNSAPVNGAYTITTTIGSAQYSGTATVADTTQLLAAPTIGATTATGSGATRTVSTSWTATGATSFRVQVLKNGSVVDSSNQTTLTRSVSLSFTTGDTYAVRVIAYPVDITAADVTVPAQFNISSADKNAS